MAGSEWQLFLLIESEQHYRRGCEILFGMNGFGVGGGSGSCGVSFSLGFSHLRLAADAGHADAQYRYGVCLLEGRFCEKDPDAAFFF